MLAPGGGCTRIGAVTEPVPDGCEGLLSEQLMAAPARAAMHTTLTVRPLMATLSPAARSTRSKSSQFPPASGCRHPPSRDALDHDDRPRVKLEGAIMAPHGQLCAQLGQRAPF